LASSVRACAKIEFHEIDSWNLVGGTSEMYATPKKKCISQLYMKKKQRWSAIQIGTIQLAILMQFFLLDQKKIEIN
jgi:hypothetical protein